MILYAEYPKESTVKLLEPTSEFNQVAGYKSDIQKSIVFLHTCNENETKKTVPFIIASKIMKSLE